MSQAIDRSNDVVRETRTIPETARIFGLSRNGGYQAAARGDFRVIKIGGRLLVPLAEISRILSARTEVKL